MVEAEAAQIYAENQALNRQQTALTAEARLRLGSKAAPGTWMSCSCCLARLQGRYATARSLPDTAMRIGGRHAEPVSATVPVDSV